MKIAYLLVLKETKYMSVLDKVLSQVESWNKFDVRAKLFLIAKVQITNPNVVVINEGSALSNALKLFKLLKCFNPDALYHRLWVFSPLLLPLITKYKLVAEINTDVFKEIELEKKSSVKSFIVYLYNKLTEKYYYKSLHSAISVTKELENYRGISNTYTVPNSIVVKDFPYRKLINREDKINIFFIGTPGMSWHGIDVLMNIAQILCEKATFHVVGFDKEDVRNTPSNVIFYGFMHIDDYSEVAKRCSIGIGTLALHRKQMHEACPLKVREYLAAGIPVVLPYIDTAFIEEAPEWVLNLDIINSGNIDKACQDILSFAVSYNHYVIPQVEVNKFIDSELLERKRIDFILSLFK